MICEIVRFVFYAAVDTTRNNDLVCGHTETDVLKIDKIR